MVNFSSSTNWLWGLFTVGVLIVARPAIADETKASVSKKVDPFEAAAKQSASDEAKASVSKEVDPFEAARSASKETSNQAMSAFVDSTVAIDQPYDQNLVGSMRKELDDTKAELAKTKEIVGELIKEYKQIAESRELPPLQDAEVRVFQLKNTKAAEAADKVELLFGTQPLRIAVDDASNGLIVFGKAEAIPQVEQLVIKLDELAEIAAAGTEAFSAITSNPGLAKAPAAARRTLMLRIFWLANGVDGLDSADGSGYLPAPVLDSLAKLGLGDPRIVTQTVNSLSVEEGGAPVEFSTNVPALLFEQPVTLTSAGTMGATTDGRANVDMQLTVGGAGVNCELKGSLATPMGHFMVLGTANSVIPEYQADDPAAAEGGMGGMPMGYGGEMGRGMGRRGEGGGFGMAMGGMPAAKYNASRFAFVVQVIEAESFEPEEKGQ